jgi:hypothetical protein
MKSLSITDDIHGYVSGGHDRGMLQGRQKPCSLFTSVPVPNELDRFLSPRLPLQDEWSEFYLLRAQMLALIALCWISFFVCLVGLENVSASVLSRILGQNPEKSLKSFPLCYSQAPLQLCLEIYISSTLAISYSFHSSATVHCEGERRNPDRKPCPFPIV